jgi:hypothetical protein
MAVRVLLLPEFEQQLRHLREHHTSFMDPSMTGRTQRKSYAMEIATKPLVMASEIAGLDRHRVYIKQESRVVPVRFRLAKKRKKQPEFIERNREKPAPRKAVEVPATAPASPAQSPPKKPVQAALPVLHAPAVKREGFVWDAKQEFE